MTTHPADARAANPRVQCAVCGQWLRQNMERPDMSPGGYRRYQRFFGGCHFTRGDHLAATPTNPDVCDDCCHVACRALAA